jgi:hypothetical protein
VTWLSAIFRSYRAGAIYLSGRVPSLGNSWISQLATKTIALVFSLNTS